MMTPSLKRTLGVMAVATCAFALSACETISEPHPISGVTWKLVSIHTSASTNRLKAPAQERHTVTFAKDGRVAMQLDCNRGTASWSAEMPQDDRGSLSIGPIAGTKALCPEPSFGERMASGLSGAQSYVFRNDRSDLTIRAEGVRYRFTAK